MEAITLTQIEKSLGKVMSKKEEPYMKKVFFNVIRYFREVQLAYEAYGNHPKDIREMKGRILQCFDVKGVDIPTAQMNKFLENPNSKDFVDLFFYFNELAKVDKLEKLTGMITSVVERPRYRPTEEEWDFLEALDENYRNDKEYYLWQLLIDVASNNTLILNDSEFDLPSYVNRKNTGNDSVIWVTMLLVRAICPSNYFDWYLKKFSKNNEVKKIRAFDWKE